MKCSNCSEEIRPIVCIDVDGTMGDYHSHFLDFAFDWMGIDHVPAYMWARGDGYDGSISFSEYCMNVLNIDLATYRQIKLAYRQGGMKRTMPILPGAQDLCFDVKTAGAELWITTTRPYLSLDNIVPDTVEWCRRHGIKYDGMLFDENKYTEFAKRVDTERVVAVLDDLPEMYDAAAAVMYYGHDVPILVTGPYNRAVRRPLMMDLVTASTIVGHRIDNWREQHDSAA